MNVRIESGAAALRRGRPLDATTTRASKDLRDEAAEIFRAANAAGVRCGRIPGVAPDGAAFRRKADALCEPLDYRNAAGFNRLGLQGCTQL